MVEHLPEFVRALVADVTSLCLLYTLGQFRYKTKWMFISIMCIVAVEFSINVPIYLFGDLTVLAKLNAIYFILIGLGTKIMFKDTWAQWCFNFITIMNATMIQLVISYDLCHFFPHPEYAVTIIRAVIAAIIMAIFYKLRPIYIKVVRQWNLFFLVALITLSSFVFYIFSSKDLIHTLNTEKVPLLFACIYTVCIYFCLFYSFRKIVNEYSLREDNLQMQNKNDIMKFSVSSMTDRVHLLNDITHQNNISAHDRRHFNNTVLELLQQDQKDKAIAMLNNQNTEKSLVSQTFCENSVVNAAISYYNMLALSNDININYNLDIPENISIDSMELAIILSNLIENAINACKELDVSERSIFAKVIYTGQLLIEIKNPYKNKVITDENGYPVSNENNHGIGTRSVIAFVEKQDAQLIYKMDKGIFEVRIVL